MRADSAANLRALLSGSITISGVAPFCGAKTYYKAFATALQSVNYQFAHSVGGSRQRIAFLGRHQCQTACLGCLCSDAKLLN